MVSPSLPTESLCLSRIGGIILFRIKHFVRIKAVSMKEDVVAKSDIKGGLRKKQFALFGHCKRRPPRPFKAKNSHGTKISLTSATQPLDYPKSNSPMHKHSAGNIQTKLTILEPQSIPEGQWRRGQVAVTKWYLVRTSSTAISTICLKQPVPRQLREEYECRDSSSIPLFLT